MNVTLIVRDCMSIIILHFIRGNLVKTEYVRRRAVMLYFFAHWASARLSWWL